MNLIRHDIRPSRFVTRESLENGIASVAATGGSTNGVLHLLAIAHEFGIPLDIDEFGAIADRTPVVADMRPGGRYTASDMYDAGGIGLVMRELLRRPGLLHGDAPTVDGRTIAQVAAAAVETTDQKVVLPIETPLKQTGGLAILHGSLAPDGCVVKLAGHERRLHRGPARVFDSETACYEAVRDRRIVAGRRRRHPLRGPGRWSGHAGDAAGHGGPRRRGARRLGGAHHRRSVQRRDPRADDRARRPGGRARRADRHRRGGRHDRHRRRSQGPRPGRPGRRDRRRRLARWSPHAPNYAGRRAGQVRGPRRVGVRRERSRPGRG